MNELLKIVNLLAESLFAGNAFALALDLGVLFAQGFIFSLQFLNDALKRLHKDFKFTNTLAGASSAHLKLLGLLDGDSLANLLINLSLLSFKTGFKLSRDRSTAELVLLKVLNSLLQTSVLQIKGLLLKFKVKQLLLSLEQLFSVVSCLRL